MTKQAKLLAFIKSGPNCTRRWGECREFYASLCNGWFKPGINASWTGFHYHLTEEEAYTRNVRIAGRAMDYALYRLEAKGLTANIARGLHQAT